LVILIALRTRELANSRTRELANLRTCELANLRTCELANVLPLRKLAYVCAVWSQVQKSDGSGRHGGNETRMKIRVQQLRSLQTLYTCAARIVGCKCIEFWRLPPTPTKPTRKDILNKLGPMDSEGRADAERRLSNPVEGPIATAMASRSDESGLRLRDLKTQRALCHPQKYSLRNNQNRRWIEKARGELSRFFLDFFDIPRHLAHGPQGPENAGPFGPFFQGPRAWGRSRVQGDRRYPVRHTRFL